MPSRTFKASLIVACIFFSALAGYSYGDTIFWALFSGAGGLFLATGCIRLLKLWLSMDGCRLAGAVVGMFVGAIFGMMLHSGVSQNIEKPDVAGALYGLLTVLCCLTGMQLGYAKANSFRLRNDKAVDETRAGTSILDTSVIIDGRIADICETGFFFEELIIPQFVLKELQLIADSSESTKRTRGRRGLDILSKIQKQSCVAIRIDETDYSDVQEVDQKLICMAKETGFSILTNDFNLNKVAEVQSIRVLNINQLANALKPIVLPGETMKVQIIKEGKEPSQGVAYLDDGTMVVIDQGKRFMGKTVEATVTSVLQTTAGRMIFASVKT